MRSWRISAIPGTRTVGVSAGEADADGVYPDGSINRRIADRLDELAKAARAFRRGDGATDGATGATDDDNDDAGAPSEGAS